MTEDGFLSPLSKQILEAEAVLAELSQLTDFLEQNEFNDEAIERVRVFINERFLKNVEGLQKLPQSTTDPVIARFARVFVFRPQMLADTIEKFERGNFSQVEN